MKLLWQKICEVEKIKTDQGKYNDRYRDSGLLQHVFNFNNLTATRALDDDLLLLVFYCRSRDTLNK